MLTGPEILKQIEKGRVVVSPLNPEHVGPNSVDLTLSEKLKVYVGDMATGGEGRPWLDMKKDNPTKDVTIPPDGLVLMPGILYLAATRETAGSNHYVPMLEGRSSIARLGICVHTAGFGDLGFCAPWTLEITVVHPVRVYAGVKICQVIFQEVTGDIKLYQGKYKDAEGVQASMLYKDFGG